MDGVVSMETLRSAFLGLHVAGGVAGLVLGIYALRPPLSPTFRLWFRNAYTLAVLVLTIFLIALVLLDWASLDAATRTIFAGLVGLALVIAIRVLLAFRLARQKPPSWESSYMKHIYFTYISLWEGFVIVGLLDLRAPGWLVGAVAGGVLILGATWFDRWRRRLGTQPAVQ